MRNSDKDILCLLSLAEFKQWVLHPTEESDMFWQKWITEHPLQRINVEKARELILRMRFKEEILSDSDKDEILNNIISVPHRHEQIRRNDNWQWLRAAAITGIILGFTFIYFSSKQEYQLKENSYNVTLITKVNPKGVKTTFELPDKTKVILNSESELIFPSLFNDSIRFVKLSGEAFFEVKKDTSRSFIVEAGNTITTALGTSFNIRAYPDKNNVEVSLLNGRVKVFKENQKVSHYILTPGEKITFSDEYEELSNYDPVMEFGWKDGILIFQNSSFKDFIAISERWFGVEFMIKGNPRENWNIDGKFDNESLEEILESISFSKDIKYEINGQKVILNFIE